MVLSEKELSVLERIQERILWLAVRMVDHANRERANTDGIKVGGHQASSASLVSVMTALYFHHLNSCLLYTSPSPRDRQKSRMPSSA